MSGRSQPHRNFERERDLEDIELFIEERKSSRGQRSRLNLADLHLSKNIDFITQYPTAINLELDLVICLFHHFGV